MFFKRKLAKKLAKIGSCVSTSFVLYVNNEQPISFECKSDLFNYLKEFRSNNLIFKLEIYRIETYSL